jgi:hypothetical protein
LDDFFIPFEFSDDGRSKLLFPFGSIWNRGEKLVFGIDEAQTMLSHWHGGICPQYRPLPIGALHDPTQGVYGHIESLALGSRGVMFVPNWRKDRLSEIRKMGWKYHSPEIGLDYSNPKTGTREQWVLMGTSLTATPRLPGGAVRVFSEGTNTWTTASLQDLLLELDGAADDVESLQEFKVRFDDALNAAAEATGLGLSVGMATLFEEMPRLYEISDYLFTHCKR